jgi:hypothetical protein
VRAFIAMLFFMGAVSACGGLSQEQQLKRELDTNHCYWTSHSDQEYRDCVRSKGWKP